MTDQKPRHKRHQRPESPPPMHLKPRDERVIEAVYAHRVMSQRQIHRLIFGEVSHTVSQRRLAKLYYHHYLDRRFLPSIGGIVTSPILYVLDKRGSEHLIKAGGYDEVLWKASDNDVGYEHLGHLLTINTFRVEMELACEKSPYSLVEWLDDTSLKQDYDHVHLHGLSRPVAVIPDGYFAISTEKGITHLFLEVDRGTMESKRYKRKILAYLEYYKSGLSQQRFGTSRFRVLTVTESHKRMENLKVATEAVDGKSRFWFGTLEDLTAEAVLNDPVWMVAGREGLHCLIE